MLFRFDFALAETPDEFRYGVWSAPSRYPRRKLIADIQAYAMQRIVALYEPEGPADLEIRIFPLKPLRGRATATSQPLAGDGTPMIHADVSATDARWSAYTFESEEEEEDAWDLEDDDGADEEDAAISLQGVGREIAVIGRAMGRAPKKQTSAKRAPKKRSPKKRATKKQSAKKRASGTPATTTRTRARSKRTT